MGGWTPADFDPALLHPLDCRRRAILESQGGTVTG